MSKACKQIECLPLENVEQVTAGRRTTWYLFAIFANALVGFSASVFVASRNNSDILSVLLYSLLLSQAGVLNLLGLASRRSLIVVPITLLVGGAYAFGLDLFSDWIWADFQLTMQNVGATIGYYADPMLLLVLVVASYRYASRKSAWVHSLSLQLSQGRFSLRFMLAATCVFALLLALRAIVPDYYMYRVIRLVFGIAFATSILLAYLAFLSTRVRIASLVIACMLSLVPGAFCEFYNPWIHANTEVYSYPLLTLTICIFSYAVLCSFHIATKGTGPNRMQVSGSE